MTVSSQDTVFQHVGNGITTTFAYDCQVPTATDLRVFLDDVEQFSGFTLTGIGDNTGGTVIFAVAPANGVQVRIERDIELERTTDYQQNGDFLSDVVNPDFDRIWMALQGHLSSLTRALKVPKRDTVAPQDLPVAADRANKLLSFDATGQPIAIAPAAQSATALQLLLASSAGAGMIGWDDQTLAYQLTNRIGRVVDSIAALRTLSKLLYTRAFATGYTNKGDGGHGAFYYDPADTTSADNGGTIIVAADGGRWKLEHNGMVSAAQFGVFGNGSLTTVQTFNAITNMWNAALAQVFDMWFPPGTYDCGINSFPFRNLGGGMLDCLGISVIAAGPATIFQTTSVDGSDVLQLNALKNFSVRGFPTLKSFVSGSASGSNGCSITNGWDNIYLEIQPFMCKGLDKGSFIDGGRGLTIQTGTGSNLRGRLRAVVLADSCTEGFGYEPDLATAFNHPTDIEVDLQARNCYIGVKAVSGGSTVALSSNMTMGVRVHAKLMDCQRDVVIQRQHGLTVEYETGGTKTAAQRRINPNTGAAWIAADTVVDSLNLSYLKNGFIRGRGNKGGCDYKVQIGGASAGSSGLSGATQYCDILLDIGGTATIADLNSINSGGNSMAQCKLDVSPITAPGNAWPSDWTSANNQNTLLFGSRYTGSFTATLTGCTTSPTGTVKYSVNGDLVSLEIPGISGTSNSTSATITGMPANLWPLTIQGLSAIVTDNGINAFSRVNIDTAGVINPFYGPTNSIFTNSGTKGITFTTVTYRRAG